MRALCFRSRALVSQRLELEVIEGRTLSVLRLCAKCYASVSDPMRAEIVLMRAERLAVASDLMRAETVGMYAECQAFVSDLMRAEIVC